MRQAVILAGGKGTRLAAQLKGLPKPLVDVAGIPLLERQLRALAQSGIDNVVVLVNYAAEMIERHLAQRGDLGVQITLIDDGAPRGTAGAVLACLDQLDDRFLVVYGDTLFNIDIARFIAHHRCTQADTTLFLHPNDHPQDSDLVEIDDAERVVAFHPYPHAADCYYPNLVNAAFYAVEKRALQKWRDFKTPSDFAKDLFPVMLRGGARLNGYSSFEYIKDLGTPDRLAKVVRALQAGVVARSSLTVPQKAIFLDRDGTVNKKNGFITRPDQLELVPSASRAIRRLNEHEYRVVLITNQPVIARGECSFAGLRAIHNKLETLLGREGAFLDGIFVCPHHPDSGYPGEVSELKMSCNCRKPNTGLVERAIERFNIDPARSWFVGDTTLDIETAARSKVRSVLVLTGDAGHDGKYATQPDFACSDIGAAADLIIERDTV